ncbi:MAG TPA: hypothetical protein PLE81_11295 [Brevundimonas sp.]|uniref:hypothetical protein n=1 Tax=Brevundimonas sp. TaxID=1871086 RepID=UPI002C8EF806|nr:hypothetical protein [Brevundimonas sp.]HRH21206.1 hypothetical protein [Brevundimonas sp.]
MTKISIRLSHKNQGAALMLSDLGTNCRPNIGPARDSLVVGEGTIRRSPDRLFKGP